MKLWRVSQYLKSQGRCYCWYGTKAEAVKDLHEKNSNLDEDDYDAELAQVEVPTSKKALVHWLNLHLGTDNG